MDLKQKLKEYLDENNSYRNLNYEFYEQVEFDGIKIIHEDQIGGAGDGAPIFVVLKVENIQSGEINYFGLSGEYSSWDCTEFDRKIYELTQKEVLVTKWVDEKGRFFE